MTPVTPHPGHRLFIAALLAPCAAAAAVRPTAAICVRAW